MSKKEKNLTLNIILANKALKPCSMQVQLY